MAGKRVINIDEAHLPSASYLRKGWGVKGVELRPHTKELGHSLGMIAAVDSNGASYFAISQYSNGSRVFSTFLQRLVITLDGEDTYWRDNTIIMLDGAVTHRSEETRRAMAALRIPAVIAGPYGFDGSPCEKLFAHLKVGDLNPWSIKTGKR